MEGLGALWTAKSIWKFWSAPNQEIENKGRLPGDRQGAFKASHYEQGLDISFYLPIPYVQESG
jgi:hypothetical protein